MTRLLIFLIVETRPNIAFVILIISCFAKNLSHFHTKAVKTIFKYLIKNKNQGIVYNQNILTIKRYLDSDWTSNKNSRKLTFSYIFILNEGLVNQCFKHQLIVILLLIKTKYITFTLVIKEATQLRLVLIELRH